MPEETTSGRDRMDALPAAVLAFSAGLELETTLHRIVTAAAGLVGARYGALALLDEDGRTTAFAVTGVDDATRERLGPPPDGHGLLGALVTGRAPVRLAHLGTGGFPPGHPPMGAFLGVPLLVRGEVLGRLYLSAEQPFTADDERATVALAAAAGIAVDNARLYEESRSRQRWLEATGEISAELLGGTVSFIFGRTSKQTFVPTTTAMKVSLMPSALVSLAACGGHPWAASPSSIARSALMNLVASTPSALVGSLDATAVTSN